MVHLTAGITIIPILHGRIGFGSYIRKVCNENKFDCVAADLPEVFIQELHAAVHELPYICAVTAYEKTASEPTLYYVPVDPCDPVIEGLRQAQQNRIPFRLLGPPELSLPEPLPVLPDEYAIKKLGFDAYTTLCMHTLDVYDHKPGTDEEAQYIAYKLHQLRLSNKNILALVHFRHIVPVIHHFNKESTHNLSFSHSSSYTIEKYFINPDHLYFALGELPFITGQFEKERLNVFASPIDIADTIKELFRETRENYYDTKEETIPLSPVRLQNGLTYLRNLTIMEKRFIPSLFDIVTAAKGIGGNRYAIRILKNAKYYPFLPVTETSEFLSVGIDKVQRPGWYTTEKAVNLFRDTEMEWQTLSIKPDPSELRKKKYRFKWNPLSMCSHLPEDTRIENFNTHIRTKTLHILCESYTKTERFETSLKDGIDIRETLRNWYKGEIHVKEIPPSKGTVDTVVIIFDDYNDEKYPHCATWYAEHDNESTLTFYASDPFEDMIGPGIARCTYGGLSLQFPPRNIPCAFTVTEKMGIKKLSHRLCYGAMLFSQEHTVAFVSARKPDIFLKKIASQLKKHLVWIPLSNFSSETLRKLRRFHVLNGKNVRSWASRFIG